MLQFFVRSAWVRWSRRSRPCCGSAIGVSRFCARIAQRWKARGAGAAKSPYEVEIEAAVNEGMQARVEANVQGWRLRSDPVVGRVLGMAFGIAAGVTR